MMRFIFSFAALLVLASAAHADLVSDFALVNGAARGKGPFGKNMLQSDQGRKMVLEGQPPGQLLFQAAFRNENAIALAKNHDFYVGNLFTTNFYELMGEYVYGDAYGSHALDHQSLLARGAQALPKANSMVRHWVLEKHYVRNFPASLIARSYLLRGISDYANEQTFAKYFFNFYLSTIQDDYQLLSALLLSKDSPIVASSSLEKARVDIAVLYDAMKLQYGDRDPGVLKLYKLRNAIHNQLSSSVIGQIDAFIAAHPGYGRSTLVSIRDSLRAYYSTSAKKIVDFAGENPAFRNVAVAAQAIVKSGSQPAQLLALSQEVAQIRSQLLNEAVLPYASKTEALVLLSTAAQFLNKEINSMSSVTSKDVIKTLVNVVYIEGFLIQDNWQYFGGEVDRAIDARAASAVFADVSDIATETLTQAFQPSFSQWQQVEPKMHYFLDNTIKSTALNTASTIMNKIR